MTQAETLREALMQETTGANANAGMSNPGTEYQIGLLNEEAQALTKEDIVRIMNNEKTSVSKQAIVSLRKLAKARLKEGRNVLPWATLEGLELNEQDDVMTFGW